MNLKKDIPNCYITYNSQIDGVNNKVRHFNVTPESIYLIDYKLSKKRIIIDTGSWDIIPNKIASK